VSLCLAVQGTFAPTRPTLSTALPIIFILILLLCFFPLRSLGGLIGLSIRLGVRSKQLVLLVIRES
jgi:hypothetical protein